MKTYKPRKSIKRHVSKRMKRRSKNTRKNKKRGGAGVIQEKVPGNQIEIRININRNLIQIDTEELKTINYYLQEFYRIILKDENKLFNLLKIVQKILENFPEKDNKKDDKKLGGTNDLLNTSLHELINFINITLANNPYDQTNAPIHSPSTIPTLIPSKPSLRPSSRLSLRPNIHSNHDNIDDSIFSEKFLLIVIFSIAGLCYCPVFIKFFIRYFSGIRFRFPFFNNSVVNSVVPIDAVPIDDNTHTTGTIQRALPINNASIFSIFSIFRNRNPTATAATITTNDWATTVLVNCHISNDGGLEFNSVENVQATPVELPDEIPVELSQVSILTHVT